MMCFESNRHSIDQESFVPFLDSIHAVLCATDEVEFTNNGFSFNTVRTTSR